VDPVSDDLGPLLDAVRAALVVAVDALIVTEEGTVLRDQLDVWTYDLSRLIIAIETSDQTE